jgi:glycine cleavage system regulatory protein
MALQSCRDRILDAICAVIASRIVFCASECSLLVKLRSPWTARKEKTGTLLQIGNGQLAKRFGVSHGCFPRQA